MATNELKGTVHISSPSDACSEARRLAKAGNLPKALQVLQDGHGESVCPSFVEEIKRRLASQWIGEALRLGDERAVEALGCAKRAQDYRPESDSARVLVEHFIVIGNVWATRRALVYDTLNVEQGDLPSLDAQEQEYPQIEAARQRAAKRWAKYAVERAMAGSTDSSQWEALRTRAVADPDVRQALGGAASELVGMLLVEASVQSGLRGNLSAEVKDLERAYRLTSLMDVPTDETDSLLHRCLRAVRAQIPDSLVSRGPGMRRLLRHRLAVENAALSLVDESAWSELLIDGGRFTVAAVSGSDSGYCVNGQPLMAADVVAGIEERVPSAVRGPSSIRISIENVTCQFTSSVEVVGSKPSEYAGSRQQEANPTYAQLQTELGVAMSNLQTAQHNNSVNPGFATGFALGLARGNVNNLRNRLANTPPYVYSDVYFPYTVEVTRATARAIVAGVVVVSDSTTGWRSAVPLEEKSDAAQDGVRGARSGDRHSYRDIDALLQLQSRDALTEAAGVAFRKKATDEAVRAVGQALVNRAARVNRPGRGGEALGYLLLAQECGASIPPAANIEGALTQSANLPLVRQRSVRVAAFRVAGPLSPESHKPAPGSRMGDRQAMVDGVLNGVVTIEADNSNGSGFFVSDNGLVVTNAHVIEGADHVVVRTRSGDSFLAKVVQVSESTDLALLRVPFKPTRVLSIAPDAPAVGLDVFAIGTPLGLAGTVTKGIVSGVRTIGGVKYLQIDAAINHGNSGGPLIDARGAVLGVNTLKMVADGAESLGFAIAGSEIVRLFGAAIAAP